MQTTIHRSQWYSWSTQIFHPPNTSHSILYVLNCIFVCFEMYAADWEFLRTETSFLALCLSKIYCKDLVFEQGIDTHMLKISYLI